MRSTSYSIAMISVHSSPLGRLGTQDTGGMSVYIRELSRQLGLRGNRVDIFTRVRDGHAPGEVLQMSEGGSYERAGRNAEAQRVQRLLV